MEIYVKNMFYLYAAVQFLNFFFSFHSFPFIQVETGIGLMLASRNLNKLSAHRNQTDMAYKTVSQVFEAVLFQFHFNVCTARIPPDLAGGVNRWQYVKTKKNAFSYLWKNTLIDLQVFTTVSLWSWASHSLPWGLRFFRCSTVYIHIS